MDSISLLDVAFRILQGLLTPVIACIAVYIAYQQHKINRDKLRFNLYGKRLKVFHSLMNLLGDISRDGDCSHGRLGKYGAEISESVFLFGKDIRDYLEKIYTEAGKLHDYEHEKKHIGALSKEKKESILKKRTEVFDWLTGQIKESQTRFEKYLGFKYSANLSERRTVNWKRGFRRIAFIFAIFIAFVCAGLSVVLVLGVRDDAQSCLRWEKENYIETYCYGITPEQAQAELERREALSPEDRTVEEKQRQPVVEERATAKAQLEELENGFLVNLSKGSLIGLCVVSGLVGGITGFVIVWPTYKLLGWLLLGFCDDEQKQ